MTEAKDVLELVYDEEAREFVKERWPQAIVTDASDSLHEGRFQVSIPGVTVDEFYPVMMAEGWAEACLGFSMAMLMPEKVEDVRRWLDAAKRIAPR